MDKVSAVSIVVYYRDGCHLCEQMRDQLADKLSPQRFSSIEWRDVDSSQNWFDEFDQRVPVLFYSDRLVAEFFLDESAISLIINSQPTSA